jgi:beta-glucosidase
MPTMATLREVETQDLVFPAGFLWGVSTAAHQVEGGNDNQWSEWEMAGHIKSGDHCGRACDWWNDPGPDFDLAQGLGLNALRLSVEWSRIEPQENHFHAPALARYREFLEGLLRRGIQPMVTLHHFTHPRWFEQQGGFLNAKAPLQFERFTRQVVGALGDLCQQWVTFNEPNVYATRGYATGEFPPGHRGEVVNAMRVMSAQARSHVLAYHAIHELQAKAEVGWAQHYIVFRPVRGALDRWVAGMQSKIFNDGFFQMMEKGKFAFPFSLMAEAAPEAKGTCDFVGLNVYNRLHVAFDLKKAGQLFGRVFVPAEVPQGDPGVEEPYGEAYPGAVRAAIERAARLGKPVYILENGVPDAQDRLRPWLIVNALREVHQAIAQGHDVRGYFHWTLTDNFEWHEGWRLRFGLVALDPETQQRTMRGSGRLYGRIAKQNGLAAPVINSMGRPEFPAPARAPA